VGVGVGTAVTYLAYRLLTKSKDEPLLAEVVPGVWDSGYAYQGKGPGGFGKYTFSNGNVWVGEWKYNDKAKQAQMHGRGTMTLKSGAKFVGEYVWANRKQGTMDYADGSHYQGGWTYDKKKGYTFEGRGTYRATDGSVFDGTYKNGIRNGRGCMKLASGDRYDGTWKDGKLQGSPYPKATWRLKSGKVEQRTWKDGKWYVPVETKVEKLTPVATKCRA